jgi:hypothetical protein
MILHALPFLGLVVALLTAEEKTRSDGDLEMGSRAFLCPHSPVFFIQVIRENGMSPLLG